MLWAAPHWRYPSDIGFDVARSFFQVHSVDAAGPVGVCRQSKRRYVLVFFQKLPRAWLALSLRLISPLVL
jgi:hypothetical protein